jgi:hypothetical protein
VLHSHMQRSSSCSLLHCSALGKAHCTARMAACDVCQTVSTVDGHHVSYVQCGQCDHIQLVHHGPSAFCLTFMSWHFYLPHYLHFLSGLDCAWALSLGCSFVLCVRGCTVATCTLATTLSQTLRIPFARLANVVRLAKESCETD